ncbi:MAG: histidinol phosphate phosphatase, partial [Planctomycetaceae bacterium]|nr:histidinol phosphate phosphatase [Planctomycetaceae bacterium]
MEERLSWAIAAAELASEFILPYYQSSELTIETKADATPVTLADRGAEQLLRNELARHFPDDGILGEEFGTTPGTSGFQWILDPIDGTKSFMHGTPLFGTLIGLLHQEQCVAGVCRFPALDEVVYARRGGGAWWGRSGQPPQQVHVRTTPSLDQSLFCFTSVNGWMSVDRLEEFTQLVQQTKLSRGWG